MDYFNELITQKPIVFNDIKIYQPTLDEILNYGLEKYNELLLPFVLNVDALELEDEKKSNIDIFSVLLNGTNLVFLLNSLSYFCRTKEIHYDTKHERLYIGKGYLDKYNFMNFGDIILKINSKTRVVQEKPPKNLDNKKRDIWNKIQAGRARAREKNQVQLHDMLNVCEHIITYIPMKDIVNWTLFNITRCYSTKIGKTSYDYNFQVYCVAGEKDLVEKHWTNLVKLEA